MNLNERSLVDLPTEIFHIIFEHLDYVRDLCCYRNLLVPNIDILDWTREEFDRVVDTDGCLEFYFQEKPLFFTCRKFMHAFKSFHPLSLIMKVFDKMYRRSDYRIEHVYF